MKNLKNVSIDLYEAGNLSEDDIFQRHAFHTVIIYEHKMLSLLQRINKKKKLFLAAYKAFNNNKSEDKNNILTYNSINGKITIRLPYKNNKRPLENEVIKATYKDVSLLLKRVIEEQGKIKWISDYDDDLVWDNREFSKRLGAFYEKQHFEDKMLEILEFGGKQTLTEEEMIKARYELGEKEFERRIRENIPIIVK